MVTCDARISLDNGSKNIAVALKTLKYNVFHIAHNLASYVSSDTFSAFDHLPFFYIDRKIMMPNLL